MKPKGRTMRYTSHFMGGYSCEYTYRNQPFSPQTSVEEKPLWNPSPEEIREMGRRGIDSIKKAMAEGRAVKVTSTI